MIPYLTQHSLAAFMLSKALDAAFELLYRIQCVDVPDEKVRSSDSEHFIDGAIAFEKNLSYLSF